MYDEIIEIAENRAYLHAVQDMDNNQGPNLELLRTMPDFESQKIQEFLQKLNENDELHFEAVFKEPIGYYHIKLFLLSDYSVDKAVFLNDVRLFKTLTDIQARRTVSSLIFRRYMSDQSASKFKTGSSVFELNYLEERERSKQERSMTSKKSESSLTSVLSEGQRESSLCSTLNAIGTNPIGVFGSFVKKIEQDIKWGKCEPNIFEKMERLVENDLKLDVFPRFLNSDFFKRYIRCRWVELRRVGIDDFDILRVLGRGAFGFVKACIKKDSGKLYAIKCIDQRRVMATDSVDTIMAEREFLSMMDSRFTVCLRYAVMDDRSLYLVLDLMVGGDLKFHLNKEERFSETRSRFYAAEILLGLEHIHSKGIVYRDMKLENVLLDEVGHCRISDLGLAVKMSNKIRGYAGTPGYTAPEVIKNKYYNHMADFFSFGVMVYRFLSGKKPFLKKLDRKERERRRQRHKKGGRRGKSDLDRNVCEMEPEYPSTYFTDDAKDFLKKLMIKNPEKRLGINGIAEIKNHAWLSQIDFGLLEAGYLDPPFAPNQDEVNADSLRHLGRSQQDDKYKKVRLTPDFKKQLENFHFQSEIAIQKEIVEVLQKEDAEKNFEKFSKSTVENDSVLSEPPQGMTACCTLM